ncbi:hypothetical protein BV25DRAFT_1921021 [Artomyces pyxidatus]|uniref:Uncharacterized protein n=1 Tax=Artomyces pyxidatus TaxID=48021 RepID=A0ACB8SII5_9AGAM|nr:hypothetical protein BV25DRAFT_1921021 [Artomyces pyxidatus]
MKEFSTFSLPSASASAAPPDVPSQQDLHQRLDEESDLDLSEEHVDFYTINCPPIVIPIVRPAKHCAPFIVNVSVHVDPSCIASAHTQSADHSPVGIIESYVEEEDLAPSAAEVSEGVG